MSTIIMMGGVGGSACGRRLLTRLSISRLARINIVIRVCSVRIKAVPELEAGEDFRCCSSPAGPPEPVIVAVTPEQQQLRLRCEGVRVTLLFDPPEPTRIRMVVKEDSEVVLNCSASGSVRDQVFGLEERRLRGRLPLQPGQHLWERPERPEPPRSLDESLIFQKLWIWETRRSGSKRPKVRDSGIYTCTFPHSAPVPRSEISLVVECILKVRPPGEGSEQLWTCPSCSGETKSEERDGRFYVTVSAIVSSSGRYSCVVTQEELCHQISSTTFVPIALPGSSTRSGSMKSLRSVSGPDGPRISTHDEPGGRLELSNDDAVVLMTDDDDDDDDEETTVVFMVALTWCLHGDEGLLMQQLRSFQIICGTRTSACVATWLRLRGPGLVPGGPAGPPEPVIVSVTPEQQQLRLRCEVRILKVRPPGKGACPEPLIRIVDGGPTGRCWSETESEERDGLFYVTVRANVSSSGNYSCVVTQEEFCHQINSTTFVPIALPGSSTRSGSMKSLRSVSGPDGPRISTHDEPGGRLELSNDDAVNWQQLLTSPPLSPAHLLQGVASSEEIGTW
ncbi:hypothetical protein D4764_0152410, partial [Takifugu flavidus]